MECKKVQYSNRKEAKAAMARYNKTNEVKGKAVYNCPYCKTWHFTTMTQKEGKRQRQFHIQQAHLQNAPIKK
jgi:hypothetical protein